MRLLLWLLQCHKFYLVTMLLSAPFQLNIAFSPDITVQITWCMKICLQGNRKRQKFPQLYSFCDIHTHKKKNGQNNSLCSSTFIFYHGPLIHPCRCRFSTLVLGFSTKLTLLVIILFTFHFPSMSIFVLTRSANIFLWNSFARN